MIPLRYYTVDRSQSAPFTVQEKLVPSALLISCQDQMSFMGTVSSLLSIGEATSRHQLA
jgi:hypothetical protein